MGMVYQFKVAKKSDLPENLKYYSDADDKFTAVGPEFDREDWIGGFIRECSDDKCTINAAAVSKAIEKLENLDKEVKYILDSTDISLDIEFRRRLARGLVSNIYGYREYHYEYPKNYYSEDSWEAKTLSDDDWNSCARGSESIRNGLKQLLPYGEEYVIWCAAY